MSKGHVAKTHKNYPDGQRPRLGKKKKKIVEIPSEEIVKLELKRVRSRLRLHYTLRSTAYSLLVVAAAAVLVASIWLPVLRIYGSSMTPTLKEGQIVVTVKGGVSNGDVVGLYVGNRLLVKRIIAGPGQWVNIDAGGNVFVDGEPLEEPYLTEKSLGDCNIKLPYQVPDDRYFVMGDHRATSLDSRNTTVGCIASDEILGRIVFKIWPLSEFGSVNSW